jgi:uncharacterized protein YfaS (alpha-2-macroglobulin family)
LKPILAKTGILALRNSRVKERSSRGTSPHVLSVSEVAISFTVAANRVILFAYNMVSGAPVSGVQVRVTAYTIDTFDSSTGNALTVCTSCNCAPNSMLCASHVAAYGTVQTVPSCAFRSSFCAQRSGLSAVGMARILTQPFN